MKSPIILLSLALVVFAGEVASQGSQSALTESSQDRPKSEHAKLYHFRTGRNLPQMASQAKPNEKIVVEVAESPTRVGLGPGIHPSYPSPILVIQTHYADAVVIGVPRSFVSGLTQDEDFVFSDWQIEVQEVLKNNRSEPLRSGDIIIATRPGGAVVLRGHRVEGRHVTFGPFRQGRRYVLFLQYIPESRCYQASAEGSFELYGDKVTKLSPGSAFKPRPNQKIEDFLAEVRAAVVSAN